jgi:hypothetical protein
MNNVFNPSQCCSSKKSRNYNRFGALSYCTGVFHNELLRPFSLVPSSDVFVSYLHIVLLEWLLNMMHDLSPNDLLLSAKFSSLFTHELYCYIYQPKMHCADYIKASHNPRIKNTEPDKPEFDDYNITMVNPRVVANPFTKDDNYMRRNTANTRWVADSEHAKVGPSKNVQYVTPRSQHVSRKASVFDSISPKAHTLVLPQDKAKPLPPSPPESYKNVARRGSPVSPISPVDFTSSEQNRKHSNATVFPFYPASIKKPEPKSKEFWWKAAIRGDAPPTPWYRVARDIYNVGPKGEGQKVWKAYQKMRKEKRKDAETKQDNAPAHTQQKKDEKPLPLPPPSTNSQGVFYPPLRPRSSQSRKGKEPESPRTRKDSGFSSTSYEVPLAIDKSFQRTVNASKPLPRVPRLDPAPRARKTFLASRPAPSPPPATVQRRAAEEKQRAEKETSHLNPWWKPLADKQSAKPSGLKARISNPGPLMTLPLLSPKHSMSEKKKEKGKQKEVERDDTPPTFWRDRFEFVPPTLKQKKKRSSDVSFGCKGVEGEMLDRYQVGELSSSEEDEKGVVPDPLFTGKGRDTRFYQLYVEALDEY